MCYLWSKLRLILVTLLLGFVMLGAQKPAHAVHGRYGHINWLRSGAKSVKITAVIGFKRSYFKGSAADGLAGIGDVFQDTVGFTQLDCGDGTQIGGPLGGSLFFKCVAIDPDEDFLVARAIDPITRKDRIDHTYFSPNNGGKPWVVEISGCCRVISDPTTNEVVNNNEGGFFRFITLIDLVNANSSAVASFPAEVPVGPNGGSFLIPALDAEGKTLRYRLAGTTDASGATDPNEAGSGFVQPPGVTVDPQTGVYSVPAGLKPGIWTTQVAIDELSPGGAMVGEIVVDFIFEVKKAVTGNAPRFDAGITPPDGTTVSAKAGQLITFTVSASDPDASDAVTLDFTGGPIGSRQFQQLPVNGNPTFSTFTWTPQSDDVGAYAITYYARDTHGNFAVTSITINVVLPITILEPNGGETYFGPGKDLSGQSITPDVVHITWQSQGLPRIFGVRLELSRDGGQTYTELIKDIAPDTGSYDWVATAPITTTARIRISNVADSRDSTVSAGNFIITDGGTRNFTAPPDPNAPPGPNNPAGPIIIPDNTFTWTESNATVTQDQIIRGLRVTVDITHSAPGDLQVQLQHPDGTTVMLDSQLHYDTPNLQTTYGHGLSFTAPYESLLKLYGKRSKGTWKLRMRDLNAGDQGQLNSWTLSVLGPAPGVFTVTAPNGGELWAIGTTQNINWTSSGVLGNADVQVSRDGGSTYTTVATVAASAGTYAWPVTGPVSLQGKVRVQSSTDPVVFDESDAVFSIVNPSLTVTFPAGGERLAVGQQYNLQWTSVPNNPGETVKIELLDSANSNFSLVIASAAPNSGSYLWTPPAGIDTTHARIRISVNSPLIRIGASAADFTIQTPGISVLSPTAGDTWFTYTKHTVTWKSVGLAGNVRLELSRDNGASYTTLLDSTPNDGSEDITLGAEAAAQAKVRVTSLDNPAVFGVSGTFEVKAMTIQVTAPNGGEVFGNGTTHSITWTSVGVPGNVDILVSANGGTTFAPLFTDIPNTGSVSWTIGGGLPGVTNSAVIRVKSHDFPAFDVSDAPFAVVNPTINVISPNGGEELRVGQVSTLKWSSNGTTGTFKIEVSWDRGQSWRTIFGSVGTDPKDPNHGSQNWTVTGPDTDIALVRITSNDTPTANDTSDGVFSIATPGIVVTRPNGGETFTGGDQETIEWESKGFDGAVKIELTRDGGASWETLFQNAANTGSMAWTVSGKATTNARVRITSALNTQISDQSDGSFTIIAQSLSLGSPNGGQEWLIGSEHTVTWSSTGLGVDEEIKLEISKDGGASWNPLAALDDNDDSVDTTPNTGSARVIAPETVTSQAMIRITAVDHPELTDTSDSTFKISGLDLRVTSPNAGAKWTLGVRQSITWAGSVVRAGGGHVQIELSRDGGRSWEVIVASTENDGSATYLVAGKATKKAKVRVTWLDNDTISAMSTGLFQIAAPPKKKH